MNDERVELAELMLMSDIGEWFLSAPYFLNISYFQYKAAAGEQQCVVAACAETVSFLGWAGAVSTLLLTVFWCWYNINISVNMTCTSVIRAVVASSQTASLISVSPALPHSSLTNSALPAPSPVKTVWEHDTSCYIKAWESNPRWWGVISWCVPLSRGR